MDEAKRRLKGSEKRDQFKHRHKELNKHFYATDADFCLVSKYPPGTVAYLDYKAVGESVTFAEAIQYNEWIRQAPVYVVSGDDPQHGPFIIRRYLGADWSPEPPDVNYGEAVRVANWAEFEKWEAWLRNEYKARGGWRGNLRGDG